MPNNFNKNSANVSESFLGNLYDAQIFKQFNARLFNLFAAGGCFVIANHFGMVLSPY